MSGVIGFEGGFGGGADGFANGGWCGDLYQGRVAEHDRTEPRLRRDGHGQGGAGIGQFN
jgi:hypothetical protein